MTISKWHRLEIENKLSDFYCLLIDNALSNNNDITDSYDSPKIYLQ